MMFGAIALGEGEEEVVASGSKNCKGPAGGGKLISKLRLLKNRRRGN